MAVVWILLTAAAAALLGAAVAARAGRKKMDQIAEILEDFKQGKLDSNKDLDDRVDSRIAFLLEEIRREIRDTTHREKTENNQVKGLISDISHQLRTPLANIRMYEELLEETGNFREEERIFLRNIREAALKSQWLLKNLVNVSRLETGVIAFEAEGKFLRETLVEAVEEILGLAREKRIRVVLEDFQDIRVLQNRRWTREVFTNILENALKYSPPDTEIRIAVRRQVSYAAVAIRDQGIGIPKEERRHIFERFYRCRNVEDETGSGLGLYLARLILLKESGNITAGEADGGGSVFTVYLKLEE